MRRIQTRLFYAFGDLITAIISWMVFFFYRKIEIENIPTSQLKPSLDDPNFIKGVILIPIVWLLVFLTSGSYKDIYRKSRIKEIVNTLVIVFLGSVTMFFTIIIDDYIYNYNDLSESFLALFLIHSFLFIIYRLLFIGYTKNLLAKGKIKFNTLIIGGYQRAVELYNEIQEKSSYLGQNYTGFIQVNGIDTPLDKKLPNLGNLSDLNQIIKDKNIEEVIIAIESSEHDRLNEIIYNLVNKDLEIKIIPDIYDIVTGSVRVTNVLGTALIEVFPDLIPQWQKNLKRIIDIVFSTLFLAVFSPLYIYIAIRVLFSSTGPIFYKQERIGIHNKPFQILKFRSMYTNAEEQGPALSKDGDPRITKWGLIMRKWRLDELPQFINVLRGDMSIVGPRPERTFFIDQIVPRAPHYKYLQKVRPGITSLGQVKYGYAENVDEMIKRLKYDILYIENMSLALDFKILFFTVFTVIKGKGK